MPKTLIQRFTYGNFADLPILSPEADFFVGVPARQRELVHLTKTQIALTREATAALRMGTSEVTSVIRQELECQTAVLSDMIRQGADMVVSAVDDLAERVSAELVEIRWQLVQLRSTNEQILQVLKSPRSTEAQELLRQGIRNLVNDKLEQAEDRFLQALHLDNTDYQILMNLSDVELRKGNPQKVAAYLQDALTLPANLDHRDRAETLWLLARLHYAEGDYRSAAELAKESLALVSRPRRLLQYGAYLVLAGDTGQGFSVVETAIRSDPRLFGLAAISSDLASSSDRLESLLSSLAREAIANLQTQRDYLLLQVEALRSLPLINTGAVTEVFDLQILGLARVLNQSAYTELQVALTHASELRQVLPRYTRLSNAERELLSATEQHDQAIFQLKTAEAALANCPKKKEGGHFVFLGCLGAVLGPIAAAFLWNLIFHDEKIVDGLLPLAFFVGPILLIAWSLVGQLQRTVRKGETENARRMTSITNAHLANATSERDRALRGASMPAWPLTGRLSLV